jgi:hypothetical protein
MAPLPFDQ